MDLGTFDHGRTASDDQQLTLCATTGGRSAKERGTETSQLGRFSPRDFEEKLNIEGPSAMLAVLGSAASKAAIEGVKLTPSLEAMVKEGSLSKEQAIAMMPKSEEVRASAAFCVHTVTFLSRSLALFLRLLTESHSRVLS